MLASDDPAVRIDDAGFQHGVGLFETFQCYDGQAFRLQQHLDRLAGSARQLGLAEQIETEPLAEAVRQTIAHNHLQRARMKLILTAGTLSMLSPQSDEADGQDRELQIRRTVAVVPSPPTQYDPQYFEQGVTVRVHGPAANPFDETAGHKTLNYWSRLRSLRLAASVGAAETIWLNLTNHLASGAVSNIFLVKDGQLLTPFARGEEVPDALRAPVLPGITRAFIIEQAHEQGLEVKRQMLSVEDLLTADEAFLTNSGWGVLPIARIEKNTLGNGSVGPLTKQLRQGWLDAIDALALKD
jgi:branched-subunit amino acid aminotransferase/4-amino-4-deoxychorismate lyase